MPTGARGHYKIQCNARWHQILVSHELLHQFSSIFFLKAEKNELDSDIYVRICGYHFYRYIWLIILLALKR